MGNCQCCCEGRNTSHNKSATPENQSKERETLPETPSTEKQDAVIVVTKDDEECTASEHDQGSAITLNRVEVNNTHVSKYDLSSGTEETVYKNENECSLEKTHDELNGTVSNGDSSSGDEEKVNEAGNESLIEKFPVMLNNTSDDEDSSSISEEEFVSDARSKGLLENVVEIFTFQRENTETYDTNGLPNGDLNPLKVEFHFLFLLLFYCFWLVLLLVLLFLVSRIRNADL